MNLLITGGSGFIGKNLIELMPHRYNIFSPGHSELDLLHEDQVRQYFHDHKINVVIHSAAKPGHRNATDLSNLFYSNTRMFFNLASNANYFEKMIVLGSGAIYDMRNYQPKMSEDFFGEHVPTDEHGFCKYVCYKYIEKHPNIIDLRLFGVFGRYEDYAIRFISNAICKTLFDLPITIKQNRKFDYLYVDDLIPVLEHFISNKNQQSAYNVTPDESIELYELAEKVRTVSGKDLPIIVGQPGMGLEYSGDNKRLRDEMPGIKFTPIDKAISCLYEWYSANKDFVNRESLLVDK